MPGPRLISEARPRINVFHQANSGKAPLDDSMPSETVRPFRAPSCHGFVTDHFLVYLTGATLFLSLLLARVFYIILDFIQVQESYTALQAKTAKASGAAGENEELRTRIAELEAKERDFGKPYTEITDHVRMFN